MTALKPDPKEASDYWRGDDCDRLRLHFKLTCRRCDSENVVLSSEPLCDYGGETGSSGGYVTFGCNDCQQNDFMLFP